MFTISNNRTLCRCLIFPSSGSSPQLLYCYYIILQVPGMSISVKKCVHTEVNQHITLQIKKPIFPPSTTIVIITDRCGLLRSTKVTLFL